mmetsp:Transcript_12815/g.14233  ORF Transcript_12815/g.14233 Transcript_12815/m.14233 type:complete len:487 (+) Transcript_12815:22-1482(+)
MSITMKLFAALLLLVAAALGGIPTPDTVSGTFTSKSLDSAYSYEGKFSKTLDSNGDWHIQGSSLDIHKNEFDTYTETTVYDDGRQTFSIDAASGKHIDGCVDSDEVPPLDGLKAAFESAKLVEKTEVSEDVDCASDLYEFSFLGLDYLACVDITTMSYQFFSKDFTAEFKIDKNKFVQAVDSTHVVSTCEKTTYKYVSDDTEGQKKWYNKEVKQTMAQKPCYFVHGAGVMPSKSMENTMNLTGFPSKEYWGDVHKHTPQCSKRTFASMDTRSRGWNDQGLQKETCAFLQADQDKIISDAIIFTHSMAGMTLAAAINSGLCVLAPSASWYQSQVPFSGSVAATYVDEGCKDALSAVSIVAAATGDYCDGRKAYPVYNTLRPETAGISALQPIAVRYLKGAQCGDSSWGLNTLYSPALALIDTLAGFKQSNDGMVAFVDSCKCGLSFTTKYQNNFYQSKTNHADGTCRSGDGWWGGDRQPCSWFENKV